MTKAVCFFVQHFHKSDRTNIGYGSYLQYWYDHAKSFGFDTMLYIDDTDDKNVPTIQNDSQDFTRLRFENLGDVLEKYPDLKIIPMVEPVEFPDWEENIWELSKKKLPKDNFMLVFGRDTGGIKVDEVKQIKERDHELYTIDTPFDGAMYADGAQVITMWEWSKEWK